MAIIKNAEIYFVKVDPKRPTEKLSPGKPRWEVQLRTRDKATRDEWVKQNLHVKLKEDNDGIYYRVNLQKNAFKQDKTAADPVILTDGRMKPLQSNTVGNGSIANVRVFQSEYEYNGKKDIRSNLMQIQVVKHIVYVPKHNDEEMEAVDTEVVSAEGEEIIDMDDTPFDNDEGESALPNVPSTPSAPPSIPGAPTRTVEDF